AWEEIYNEEAPNFIKDLESWKNKARNFLAVNKKAHAEGTIIDHFGLIDRPVDKRENYIKRCVGIPGDELELIDAILYVNGKPEPITPYQNLQYTVMNPEELIMGLSQNNFDNQMYESFGLEKTRGD